MGLRAAGTVNDRSAVHRPPAIDTDGVDTPCRIPHGIPTGTVSVSNSMVIRPISTRDTNSTHDSVRTDAAGTRGSSINSRRLPAGRSSKSGAGRATSGPTDAERIPAQWQITLSDFSPGMVGAAKESLSNLGAEFAFVVCDEIQEIPFGVHEFDVVIANHMLYHVPDRRMAFAEIRRVLKPGGRLYAAANGKGDKRSITELGRRVSRSAFPDKEESSDWFSLESGRKELDKWFSDVRVRRSTKTLYGSLNPGLSSLISSRSDDSATRNCGN